MNASARIAALYTLFAVFSVAVNIAAQAVCIALWRGPWAVELSILVGTVAGLPPRYILEKRWIFAFRSRSLAHDGRLFALYTAMAVLTTLIFWGVEYAFHLAFGSDGMRYLGGVLGLALGFVLKYRLDKRYVFVGPQAGDGEGKGEGEGEGEGEGAAPSAPAS